MTPISIARLGSIKSAEHFQEHLRCLGIKIPCDKELQNGRESSLRQPLIRRGIRIDNRIAVQPMEGWDCTLDGNPTENTLRRWQRFGRSGAKLIWGGEAAAVSQDGRANPNQLLVAPHTEKGLDQLRRTLIEEHRRTTGSGDGLLIGLQLTHSGRYSRPNAGNRGEPRILYRHPILDGRLNLASDYPVLTDGEVQTIIENFHRAAAIARKLGFDFVDIKHCHGYLGHEFLSARTREGAYGGSFEGRSRFLREVVQGINSGAPKLHVAVRLSAFDTIPFRPDATQSSNGKLGSGIPERDEAMIPYRWGFGVDALHPTETDLTETVQFLALLEELGDSNGEYHWRQSLLQSSHSASGVVSAVGWISTAGGPAVGCGAADGCNATLERTISQSYFCGFRVQLSPGLSALCCAGCGAGSVDGFCRTWPYGAFVPGDLVGRFGREAAATQAGVQNF